MTRQPHDLGIVTAAEHTPAFTRKSEADVVELKDGCLFLAFMEFSGDGSDEAHTRLAAITSRDGGATWGEHRVLADTAPGDMNVYSPNLIRMPDGAILFLFMRQHREPRGTATQYAWRSTDECRTFEPLATFAPKRPLGLCNAVVKRLSSGRLLLPLGGLDADAPRGAGAAGFVLFSDDGGATWREARTRLWLPMRGVMEPHVEEARDGRIVMVMRSQLGAVFRSDSSDGGETWSLPQSTGLSAPESCPELSRVPSTGDLLLIWNHSPYDPWFASHYGKRSPLTAALSADAGRTWTHVRDIETDPARAFSNPGCRFTRDGRAVIHYWTCEYLPDWRMQDVIDLRVAVVDTAWFYG
jgi:sialidase-1